MLDLYALTPNDSLPSAITHGISHLVGQVAVGTLADLVLWKPENFGAKPEMVLKSGVIAWAQVRPVPAASLARTAAHSY